MRNAKGWRYVWNLTKAEKQENASRDHEDIRLGWRKRLRRVNTGSPRLVAHLVIGLIHQDSDLKSQCVVCF